MRKALAAALLVAYLLVLLDLTLFQFPQPGAAPNLVPFRNIAHDLRVGGRGLAVNVLGNLAAFVPLGLLLPWLPAGRPSARRVAMAGLGLSLAIEAAQFLSGRRVADVDDVILNVLGGLLGYLAYLGLWWARSIGRRAGASRDRRPPSRPAVEAPRSGPASG